MAVAGRLLTVARLDILEYPDERLHRIAREVTVFDEALWRLVADMAETMYAAPGVGLAAVQVDVSLRVIVVDTSEGRDALRVFVNPRLTWASEETALCEEGCLSVPGIYDQVRRPAQVRVAAFDEHGRAFELDCEGMLAVCVQHEIDHLEGRVFVEYLSSLKQTRIRTRLRKRRLREA